MDSAELIQLMEKIEQKGIGWTEVEKELKVPYSLLKLYARSGPVPVTVIAKLKKFIEAHPS
jgi:hypothetical protein